MCQKLPWYYSIHYTEVVVHIIFVCIISDTTSRRKQTVRTYPTTSTLSMSTSLLLLSATSKRVCKLFPHTPPINIEYLICLWHNNKPHPNLKKLQKKFAHAFQYCTNKNSTTVKQSEQHIILLVKYMNELWGAKGTTYPHSPFHISASPLRFASEFPIFPLMEFTPDCYSSV
jgi:hypothetical protein